MIEQVLRGYNDLFSGLGKLPGTCLIDMDPNAKPVQENPRRVPIPVKDKLKGKNLIPWVLTNPSPWINNNGCCKKAQQTQVVSRSSSPKQKHHQKSLPYPKKKFITLHSRWKISLPSLLKPTKGPFCCWCQKWITVSCRTRTLPLFDNILDPLSVGIGALHTATAPAVRAAVKTVVSCRCFAKCTGFSFPVPVQNATTENSSILRFVNKSKSL